MAKGVIVAGSLNDGLRQQQNAVGVMESRQASGAPYDVERKVVKVTKMKAQA
jgi:hypothetical protein